MRQDDVYTKELILLGKKIKESWIGANVVTSEYI